MHGYWDNLKNSKLNNQVQSDDLIDFLIITAKAAYLMI